MIGTVIQDKRKALGLTQAQLAELLGVTAPAVNRWEKNLCFPDAALLAPLARCLHTDLNGLFSFYDSLSDKERELIVDRAGNLLLHSGDEEALAYISEMLKQNLSDGLLYQKMADLLFSFHVAVKASRPTAYLKEAAEYYERALELLPDKRREILSSLMSIYAKLGDSEKAEATWRQLPEYAYSKKWLHAEMLFNLENYAASAEETKSLILSDIIDLALHIHFLECTLSLVGDSALAEIAAQKAASLSDIFDLWPGIETLRHISKAVSESNADGEAEHLLTLIQSNKVVKEKNALSRCPLFENRVLSSSGEAARTVCEKLLEDFRNMGCYIQWGKGATQGGFTPVFRGKNQKYRISPVYAYKAATKIEIPFNELKPPFHTEEKKQELLTAFNSIDALHFPDNPERPSFDCKLLANDTAYNRFMEICGSMISEIKAYEG